MGNFGTLLLVTTLVFISATHAAIVPQANFQDHSRQTDIPDEFLGKGPVPPGARHVPTKNTEELNNRQTDIPPERLGLGPAPALPKQPAATSAPVAPVVHFEPSPSPEPTAEAQESRETSKGFWYYFRSFYQ